MTPERFAKLKQVLATRQHDLTVIMEQVHKPHNFAAIVRSAEAVGIAEVHATTVAGKLGQKLDTYAGSSNWVQVTTHQTIDAPIAKLRAAGSQILVAHLDEQARDFRQIDYCQPTAIIMGSELVGASAHAIELADASIVIPMHGLTASLNVSVACALILFEAERQRQLANLYTPTIKDADEFERKLFEWCYPKVAYKLKAQNRAYPQLDEHGFLQTSL